MEPDQNKGFEIRVTKDSKETEEKVTEITGKADKEEVVKMLLVLSHIYKNSLNIDVKIKAL